MGTVCSIGAYRVNVVPGPKDQFLWVLLKDGRSFSRSSTLFSSEADAASDALTEIELLMEREQAADTREGGAEAVAP